MADLLSVEDSKLSLVNDLQGIPLLTGIIGGVIGLVMGWNSGGWFFDQLVYAVLYGVMISVVGAAVGAFLTFILFCGKRKREEKTIEQNYQKEERIYQKNLRDTKARINRELQEKALLVKQRDMLSNKLSDSKSKLAKYYDIVNIDLEYRNIISIGYINKFIKLGISNKLHGIDGLYYLIMQELHWNQLHYTLQEISTRFDTIIENQNRLYREICEINQKCDRLVMQTERSIHALAKSNCLLEISKQRPP